MSKEIKPVSPVQPIAPVGAVGLRRSPSFGQLRQWLNYSCRLAKQRRSKDGQEQE